MKKANSPNFQPRDMTKTLEYITQSEETFQLSRTAGLQRKENESTKTWCLTKENNRPL